MKPLTQLQLLKISRRAGLSIACAMWFGISILEVKSSGDAVIQKRTALKAEPIDIPRAAIVTSPAKQSARPKSKESRETKTSARTSSKTKPVQPQGDGMGYDQDELKGATPVISTPIGAQRPLRPKHGPPWPPPVKVTVVTTTTTTTTTMVTTDHAAGTASEALSPSHGAAAPTPILPPPPVAGDSPAAPYAPAPAPIPTQDPLADSSLQPIGPPAPPQPPPQPALPPSRAQSYTSTAQIPPTVPSYGNAAGSSTSNAMPIRPAIPVSPTPYPGTPASVAQAPVQTLPKPAPAPAPTLPPTSAPSVSRRSEIQTPQVLIYTTEPPIKITPLVPAQRSQPKEEIRAAHIIPPEPVQPPPSTSSLDLYEGPSSPDAVDLRSASGSRARQGNSFGRNSPGDTHIEDLSPSPAPSSDTIPTSTSPTGGRFTRPWEDPNKAPAYGPYTPVIAAPEEPEKPRPSHTVVIKTEVTPPELSSIQGSDELWTHIVRLPKMVSGGGSADFDVLSRIVEPGLDAIAEFNRRYPDDVRVWDCRLFDIQLRGLRELSASDMSEEYWAVSLNRNAQESTRVKARLLSVSSGLQAVLSDSPGTLLAVDDKIATMEAAQPPVPLPETQRLRAMEIAAMQRLDPVRYTDILRTLALSRHTEIAATAKGRLVVADFRTKPLDYIFRDMNGHDLDLGSLRGKVVLLDFWCSSNPVSRDAALDRVGLYNRLRASGFEIIGISLDENRQKLVDTIADFGILWPQHWDAKGWNSPLITRHAIQELPTLWLLDKKGVVNFMHTGAIAPQELELRVKKLLLQDYREHVD